MGSPANFQSDVGIKISKPYYDVNTAADKDLIFSSSWPSLQVVYDGVATATTISHGLGFPPLAFTYTTLGTTNPYVGDRVALSVTSSVVNTTIGLRTIIYNLDISTSKTYAVSRTTSVLSNYNSDYGIKIVKEGEDINSDDMRDFILHSRCQSPLILKVLTIADATQHPTVPTTYQIFYTWTETSAPFMYGFELAGSTWSPAPYNAQAYPSLVIGNAYGVPHSKDARLDIATGTHTNGSIVILRDPMFSPTLITATY